jgi:hypothetical protein
MGKDLPVSYFGYFDSTFGPITSRKRQSANRQIRFEVQPLKRGDGVLFLQVGNCRRNANSSLATLSQAHSLGFGRSTRTRTGVTRCIGGRSEVCAEQRVVQEG